MTPSESRPSGKVPIASRGTNSTDAAVLFQHKAFLSYNQKADGVLAKALETALEQFSKKWYQRRAFDVFRDATALGANTGLWPTLQVSLQETEFFILLASPESAESPWVRAELNYWLENRGCEQLLIVLTSGRIAWPEGDHDFDWTKTNALNRAVLTGKFRAEPLWVDCSWARGLAELKITNDKRFADAVATLASPLHHGVSKSDLFGEDLRQHRRQMLLAKGALISLSILFLGTCYFWWQATTARRVAEERALVANSRRLAALSVTERTKRLDRSILLAAEASRIANTLEARKSLYDALHERQGIRTILNNGLGQVHNLAFNPKTQTLAAAYGYTESTAEPYGYRDRGSGVVLWELAGRTRLVSDLAVPRDRNYSSVAFSTDGRIIAIGSDDGVSLWNLASLKCLVDKLPFVKEGEGALGGVNSLAFSHDGKILAAGHDQCVVLWDLASQKPLPNNPLNVKKGTVTGVAFHPGSKLISAAFGVFPNNDASHGGDGGVLFWDITQMPQTKKPCAIRKVKEGYVSCVAYSPDGKLISAGYRSGDDGKGGVVLWNTDTFERVRDRPLAVEQGDVHSVAFSPNSKTLAAGFGVYDFNDGDGGILRWEVLTLEPLPNDPLVVKEGLVSSIAFSPDGETIAAGFIDGSDNGDGVVLWDLSARRPLESEPIAVEGGDVKCVAFSTDRGTIAAGYAGIKENSDGGVARWDLTTRKRLVPDPLKVKQGEVDILAFRPDGKTVAAGFAPNNQGRAQYLWDSGARRPLVDTQLAVREGDLTRASFSPDRNTLAAVCDGGIVLWDLASGQRPRNKWFSGDKHEFTSVAFSPDGKTLAAGYRFYQDNFMQSAVALLDAADGKRTEDEPFVLGVDREISSVTFSSDGKTIAAGFTGGLMTWDVREHKPLADGRLMSIDNEARPVVSLSSDGKTLATVLEGRVVLGDLDLESWLQIAARMANRNFTPKEWKEYFHKEPYRRTFQNLP